MSRNAGPNARQEGQSPPDWAAAVYAHSLPPPAQPQDWELLSAHSAQVADLAGEFASAFNASAWGALAGRWHDLGKYQPEFQKYIRGQRSDGPPHAWFGAIHALLIDRRLLPVVAAIAAHHGALANVQGDEANGVSAANALKEKISQWRTDYARLKSVAPSEESIVSPPPLPSFLDQAGMNGPLRVELFMRFLYSALIDADRLATAHFYARFIPALTSDDAEYDAIPDLALRLDAAIDRMTPGGSPAVNDLRCKVLAACRAYADEAPGRFSLTVPTGGGKTLSAMSFALNHAVRHGLRRVIVVIPYTSIIEQSARVYRNVLNDPRRPDIDNVLEHHSNIDEQARSESDARGENLRKLAAENWSAPVVVTTTVQFFESLLAAHGSRCRKVHRIARSVVLLDEVQTLPRKYFDSIVDLLGQLTDCYGCSVVLSTATPPALSRANESSREGLENVREIAPDPPALAAASRRVKIEWRIDQPTPYTKIADELSAQRQVLAIVHRRADARLLAELVKADALHLSAAMCPAHRLAVIDEVRRRLAQRLDCRLIATQLIEAGVDVDFPIVYRSLAGLDSIAQSAGRCDREGKLTDAAGAPAGRVVVFLSETEPPPGTLKKALQSMQVLLKLGPVDPLNPNDSLAFFRELYRKMDADPDRVQMLRSAYAFSTVAETFKLIDGDSHSVVVPYINASQKIDGAARIAAYRSQPTRETSRALQPLIVQVRGRQLDLLRESLLVEPLDDFGRYVLCTGRERAYDPVFGLAQDPTTLAGDDMVV